MVPQIIHTTSPLQQIRVAVAERVSDIRLYAGSGNCIFDKISSKLPEIWQLLYYTVGHKNAPFLLVQ